MDVRYFMNFYLLVSGYDINTIYGSFFDNILNACMFYFTAGKVIEHGETRVR